MRKPDYSWIRGLDVYSPEEQEAWIRYFEEADEVGKEVNDFRYKVESVLQDIKDLLVEKNESYGNSALEPINVFSKATAVEQIKVRVDDKINRLYAGKEFGQEDTVTDLIGYLVLLKIAQKEENENHR